MQTMQDTIARLSLSAHPPDVLVRVPQNACGFFEFWRAEELTALGRDCAARAFAAQELSARSAADRAGLCGLISTVTTASSRPGGA